MLENFARVRIADDIYRARNELRSLISWPAPDPSMVYFAECSAGPIKIGLSAASTIERRIETLRVACPYDLILRASVYGDRHTEYTLHRIFEADRLHGEWFSPSEKLLKLIESIRSRRANSINFASRAMRGFLAAELRSIPIEQRRALYRPQLDVV